MDNKYTCKVLLLYVIFFPFFFVNYVYSPSLQINIPKKIPIKTLNLKWCGLLGFRGFVFFFFKVESKYVVGKTVHNMDMENTDCFQWHKVWAVSCVSSLQLISLYILHFSP